MMGTHSPERGGRGFGTWRRWTLTLAAAATVAGAAFLVPSVPAPDAHADGPPLTTDEVTELISRAATYSRRVPGKKPLTIAVVDVEGNSLGVFNMTGTRGNRSVALSKAATAAYFSSDFGTFTTRTAAFIIQDHFPPGVRFAPGGPLYGVEFSSIATSDVNAIYYPRPQDVAPGVTAFSLPEIAQARVRGELGGVAIYKNGRRVGAIGVDDGAKRATLTIPTKAIINEETSYRLTFRKLERGRSMERVAFKAASGFLPDRSKRAVRITVDGFRLPYKSPVALKTRPVSTVVAGVDGDFDPEYPVRDASTLVSRFVPLTLDPPATAGANAQSFEVFAPVAYPIIASTDGNLSAADVQRMLWQGVQRANITRAAIRRPIGLAMQCWVTVVDTNGAVLGVVRTPDATLFSYDVAVQKARTALLFSDSSVAWGCRGLGQHAQNYYPAGQQNQSTGPMWQLQDGVTVGLLTGAFGSPPDARIANGITIFPGGVPLYRNGAVIGAVGVSGDGVDQDDIVADFASVGFQAPRSIRCDNVTPAQLKNSLLRATARLGALAPAGPLADPVAQEGLEFFQVKLRRTRTRLKRLEFRVAVPFVKHPRHPGPVTIRVD